MSSYSDYSNHRWLRLLVLYLVIIISLKCYNYKTFFTFLSCWSQLVRARLQQIAWISCTIYSKAKTERTALGASDKDSTSKLCLWLANRWPRVEGALEGGHGHCCGRLRYNIALVRSSGVQEPHFCCLILPRFSFQASACTESNSCYWRNWNSSCTISDSSSCWWKNAVSNTAVGHSHAVCACPGRHLCPSQGPSWQLMVSGPRLCTVSSAHFPDIGLQRRERG